MRQIQAEKKPFRSHRSKSRSNCWDDFCRLKLRSQINQPSAGQLLWTASCCLASFGRAGRKAMNFVCSAFWMLRQGSKTATKEVAKEATKMAGVTQEAFTDYRKNTSEVDLWWPFLEIRMNNGRLLSHPTVSFATSQLLQEKKTLTNHFLADGIEETAIVFEFLPACVANATKKPGWFWRMAGPGWGWGFCLGHVLASPKDLKWVFGLS